MIPWRKISRLEVMTKFVVSHFIYRMTSQMAVPTRRMRVNTRSTLPTSPCVLASTMMPRMMLKSNDHAGSAKYHQCGCISRAIVSLAFRFFFGNGMDVTVVNASRSYGHDTARRPGRIVSP